MPEKDRVNVAQMSYDVELRIKDLDYSADLIQFRITTSLSSVYQVVGLDLKIDPGDLILEDGAMGEEPIKLKIHLYGQEKEIIDSWEIELMFIDGAVELPLRPTLTEDSQAHKERVIFSMTTLARQPFKTMTTLVNEVYEGTTLRSVIEDLASKTGAIIKTYDSGGENKETIDQIVIPPTTLTQAIKYLDREFGLYDGPYTLFCQYDNKIEIKNLSKKMKQNQTFTVYHLANDEQTDEIIDKSVDGKNFYTTSPINTDYIGNNKYATLSKNINHIVKPKDSLFKIISKDLDDVAENYGLIDGKFNPKIDSNIEGRTRYHIDHIGYNETETFANAKISRQISNLNFVSLNLARNLPVLSLINVGEPVKLVTRSSEYISLGGKYILYSSDLHFSKVRNWDIVAKINLIRTNKTI